MDAAKPKAVFFTGTNGSGKSTMRESMLKDGEFSQDFVHIDPDKIAREINPDGVIVKSGVWHSGLFLC